MPRVLPLRAGFYIGSCVKYRRQGIEQGSQVKGLLPLTEKLVLL